MLHLSSGIVNRQSFQLHDMQGICAWTAAQIGPPANARHRFTPTVRRNKLFPDMFDLVITAMLLQMCVSIPG